MSSLCKGFACFRHWVITLCICGMTMWPVAGFAQSVAEPKDSAEMLRLRLAPQMNPPGRPMPADAAQLDRAYKEGQYLQLVRRLNSPSAPDAIALDLNWEQSRLFDGAGFVVTYGYMNALWRLAQMLPVADRGGIEGSAAMVFLYNYILIAVDGVRCGDATAPVHRRDQLLQDNRAIVTYLANLPVEARMRLASVAVGLERATSHVRRNDPVLCRGGMAEIIAGLQAQGSKPLPTVPAAPGSPGDTVLVPPIATYTPSFIDEATAGPKQDAIRQALPETLTRWLQAPATGSPAP